jgi:hypothetical protein
MQMGTTLLLNQFLTHIYTGFRSPVLQVSGQMFSGHRVAYISHHIVCWPLKLSKF